ncbi:hypothetical protein [Plantactinospora soyae]|uniref:Uncharacterized protein n=1 Tax=Plantactinospora soyae TaxID=1544732 RepID=A0A927M789_9ACTN|nr:hypothetical protein [Plantactinospora soyae]MBE1488322.1 hypothetical protein [Plantactinospora soyae]
MVEVERDEPSVAVDVGVAPVQVCMDDPVRAVDRSEPLDLAGQSLAELAEFGEVRRGPARAGIGCQAGQRPFDEDVFVEVVAVVALAHLDGRCDGVLPIHELGEVLGVEERVGHAHIE